MAVSYSDLREKDRVRWCQRCRQKESYVVSVCLYQRPWITEIRHKVKCGCSAAGEWLERLEATPLQFVLETKENPEEKRGPSTFAQSPRARVDGLL